MMEWELGSWVRAGEIINTRRNSVRGWVHFFGCRQPLLLQLTGNCHGRLRGRHLRFRAAGEQALFVNDLQRLQPQQIGPAVHMDLLLPGGDAEQPPKLRLEWYSQNGWIRLHLQNPQLEFLERLGGGAARAQTARASQSADAAPHVDAELDAASEVTDSWHGSGELDAEFSRWRLPADEYVHQQSADSPDYWHLIHEMSAGDQDVPLSMLFDPPLQFSPASQLTDREIVGQLQRLLARLAIHGIAVDVCEHFTDRDTYRVLLDEILPHEETYPRLPQIGYVQHYVLRTFCPRCEVWS